MGSGDNPDRNPKKKKKYRPKNDEEMEQARYTPSDNSPPHQIVTNASNKKIYRERLKYIPKATKQSQQERFRTHEYQSQYPTQKKIFKKKQKRYDETEDDLAIDNYSKRRAPQLQDKQYKTKYVLKPKHYQEHKEESYREIAYAEKTQKTERIKKEQPKPYPGQKREEKKRSNNYMEHQQKKEKGTKFHIQDNKNSKKRKEDDQPMKYQREEQNNNKVRKEQYNKDNLYKYQEGMIPLQNQGLEDKLKKLKKIFIEENPSVEEIKIYSSKFYPTIIFEYYQNQDAKDVTVKLLRQVLKDSRKIKENRSLFEEIYERLFLKVDKKYWNIAVFFLQKARKIKQNLTKNSIFNLQQGHDVMFYYMIGKNEKINFIIYDCFMRNVEMDSVAIQDLQKDHPDQFKIYNNFKKKVFQKEPDHHIGTDLLDNQEASSDEDDRPNFEERTLKELQKQLQEKLNKNLTELEEKIEKMNRQLMEEAQFSTESTKYKILQQKIQDLQSGVDLFYKSRDDIIPNYNNQNGQSKDFIKRALKKLIIAQKQLESGLPIIGKKRKIFDMLKRQNLIIIEGQTGSGKSTQLPQILCEYYGLFDNPRARPVLVTQPRRLATRSLAERVAKEMGQTVGGFVDYVASAGKAVSQEAKIIFKLDRIVLDELTEDPILSQYSCLVIDQAHERTISIDVILGLIKQLLERRKDFKIIVTSASMDIQLFEKYYETKTLKVSGRMYPVNVIHKDYKNYMEGDKYQIVRKIQRVINEQILNSAGNSMVKEYKGHLLCFCSQIDEIEKLVQIYTKKLNPNMFAVFPLHGKVTPAEQKKVFEEIGKHKFIFASRIAETAITIDGVKVVIDPGKDLELIYDQKYKYTSMKMQDITKSSAKQRAGRAGRTGPGFCFRLYSQQQFNGRPQNKTPQIQNSSLETVVLRLKTLRIKDVINFPYISRPSKEGLQTSLELLTLIGTLQGKELQVTKIGRLLVKIPIEPFLSRAIVESMMFEQILKDPRNAKISRLPQNQLKELQRQGVTQIIISILALVVNFSNLFFIRKTEREAGESIKYEFSDEEGDFFFLNNIYRKFKALKNRGNKKQLYNWINDNYLSSKSLNQTEDLIQEISKIISGFSIDERLYEDQLDNVKAKIRECSSKRDVILSCLITSFSPNICKFSGNSHLGYTMVSQRKPLRIYGMSNLDLLGKFPQWIVSYELHTNQQGRLYCKLAHQVTYDFMRKHLDTFVWKKFNIEGIQKSNPFYKQISKQFPTKIIQQFKFDYNKSEEIKKFQFLKDSYPQITEERNRITFFIESKINKQEDFNIELEFQEKLAQYEIQIINRFMDTYRHSYIGNVYACMFDGFDIQGIEFNNNEFFFEIVGPSDILQQIALDCQSYARCFIEALDRKSKEKKPNDRMYVPDSNKRLKVFIQQEENKFQFQKYLQIITFYSKNLEVKESLVDKRRKIPKTKIFMHYFAGTAAKDNLYASYDLRKEEDGIDTHEMVEIIKQGIRKCQHRCKLDIRDLKASKNGNGINIFSRNYDQYEIAEQLFRMDKQGLFAHTFKMPKFIKKFREPEISQARKSDDEWKAEINNLLDQAHIKKENVIINVRGIYRPDNKGSNFQKTLRVDMRAEIITLDNTVLQKLKNKYDGREGIIGCEKVHFRANYEQIIATATAKAFQSLEQQFYQQLKYFKEEFPLMHFDIRYKQTRKQQKVFIYAYSSNREDFIKPMRIISTLFTPKILKLEDSQYRFLNKMDKGAQILEFLEKKYKYKIYFGFDSINNFLRVYCEDKDLKPIEAHIKESIKKFKFYTERISYRGKNLNKVKEILQNYQKDNKGLNMSYQISFQKRQLIITADINTFQQIKNSILKLVDSDKKECAICADIMRNPYRLMICGCSFCWLCLAEHVRTYRNSSAGQKLCCPDLNCNSPLNIYDIKTLVSEQEFQKICDIKISKYLQANPNKYLGCKYCENVFDRKEVEEDGEINCQICGKIECLKCGQSHPNYTCEEWKNKDNFEGQLSKFGIKKCPNCKTGIQKNGGCNHVQCTNCKIHICWKCTATFDDSRPCYDHLAKKCGGIFDPV